MGYISDLLALKCINFRWSVIISSLEWLIVTNYGHAQAKRAARCLLSAGSSCVEAVNCGALWVTWNSCAPRPLLNNLSNAVVKMERKQEKWLLG